MSRTIVLILAATVSATPALGADFDLGPVTVRDGMTSAEALPILREHFQLRQAGDRSWLLIPPGRQPNEFTGTISFDDTGLLAEVRRDWSTSYHLESLTLAKALAALVRRHSPNGRSSMVLLQVSPGIETPELSGTNLSILFLDSSAVAGESLEAAPVRVELNIYENNPTKGGGQVSVNEVFDPR